MTTGPGPASMRSRALLLLGDALALLVVTALGFASHGELNPESAPRFPATYLPFLLAWVFAAATTGALDPERAREASHLWRPAAAAVLAAPMGALLRGMWLGTPVLPIFVAVMGSFSTVALMVWRSLYRLYAHGGPRPPSA